MNDGQAVSAFVPGSHQDAAHSLVDMATCQTVAYKNRLLSAPIEDAHACILEFSRAFLKDCQRRGWPLFPHQYYRGQREQELALARGNSRAAFGKSPHNFGMAVDIVHFGKYWELNPKQWSVIGLVGKEVARRRNIKITWGGDFKSLWDPAHWELADWKARVKAGQ